MSNIKVPPLGESVTEATVAKWFKKEGDAIQKDEILVELETDKVTLEVNADSSGILKEIKVPEGETVEVGALLGKIEEGAVASVVKKEEKKPELPRSAQKVESQPTKGADGSGPAARKLMAEHNVDATVLEGTGKDGRITKGDVLSAIENAASYQSNISNTSSPRENRVKMTKLRQAIARRLKESQNTAAMLTTFNEIDMTDIMDLRKKLQDDFVAKHGVKLGFMSLFTKAAINALKEIPAVNAEIDGDEIVYKNHYDIGMAVGTEQGLVVPVMRDADQLSFAGVEKEIIRLAKLARDGKLSIKDLTGGTFTVTNGGIYGSMLSTPIINPPQSAILGLHNIVARPVAINGEIKIRQMMYVALSYDHRIIDGREAVTFLVRIKQAIENPNRMLLEI